MRLSLNLYADSPIILLPVSSRSSDLLVADLGRLEVTNCFKYSGDEGTISVIKNEAGENLSATIIEICLFSWFVLDDRCLLDVMSIDLQNMDLYCAIKDSSIKEKQSPDCFSIGGSSVHKRGTSLLTEKCHLKLQVERNLDSSICHNGKFVCRFLELFNVFLQFQI